MTVHLDLPSSLAAPARRALANAGYTSLTQLSAVNEAELSKLHGMGPKALGQLREALAAHGLAFAAPEHALPKPDITPMRARTDEAVAVFIAQLEHPRKAEIELVRALILSADQHINESIKWNAPSFALTDHFATFKLRPEVTVQVVFHTGAKVKPMFTPMQIDDPTGLLAWASPDRGLVTFADMAAVLTHKDAFVALVQQWIAQLSPEHT